MTKQEITQKLVEAINKNPYKKDIREVFLFGSYAYGKPTEKSDVDILIDFEPESPITYFTLAHIQRNFQENIGKKVDLLTPGTISEFIQDEVFSKMQKIYEKR